MRPHKRELFLQPRIGANLIYFVFREQIQVMTGGEQRLFHPCPAGNISYLGFELSPLLPLAAAARSKSRLFNLNLRNAGTTVSSAMTAVM